MHRAGGKSGTSQRMKTNPEHDRLFARACEGIASAEELTELHRLLRTDSVALDAWLHYSALHSELAAGAALAAAALPEPGVTTAGTPGRVRAGDVHPASVRSWVPWCSHAAAALAAGLFAATVVWAYVLPPAAKPQTLLHEDFESPAAPLAIRAPLETGIWRGDAAEIVGREDGVQPERGRSMMRLLRADFDGKSKHAGGHIAVAYRMIDLRPFRDQFADGAGVVEASASFNASAFSDAEEYGCAISLYALDEDSVPDRPGRLGSTLTNEALAMARSSRARLDRERSTWQRVTTELRLPADAEFLVLRLHITQVHESAEDAVFTGSYVDDVRISLTRRAPLP